MFKCLHSCLWTYFVVLGVKVFHIFTIASVSSVTLDMVTLIRECVNFLGNLSPRGLHGFVSAWTGHSQDCSCSLHSFDYTSRWILNLFEDFNISTWDFHFDCVESTAQLGGNWYLSRCLLVCKCIFLHLFESYLFLYKSASLFGVHDSYRYTVKLIPKYFKGLEGELL